MSLKAVLESLDETDESLHGLYTEIGGKFVLQVEGINSHPAVVNLKSAYEKTKRDLGALKTAQEKFADLDVDQLSSIRDIFGEMELDDIKALKEKAESGKPADVKALEEKIANLQKAVQERADPKEYKAAVERRDMLMEVVRKDKLDAALRAAVATSGVRKGLVDGAVAYFMARGPKLEEVDGGFRGVFDSDMGPQTIEEYVEGWAKSDEALEWLEPRGGSGSGASSGGASGGSGARSFDRSSLDAWSDPDAILSGKVVGRG